MDGSEMMSEFEYSCPAGSSKTFDILVPFVSSFPYHRGMSIDSELEVTLSSGTKSLVEHIYSAQEYTNPSVLLSSALFIEHASKLDALITSKHSSHRHTSTYASSFNPNALPNDWRAYIAYDSLVCTDKEWISMEKSVNNAILEWNRLGGKLLILRLNQAATFKTMGISDNPSDATKLSIPRSFGLAKISNIAQLNSADIPNIIQASLKEPQANQPKAKSILKDYDSGAWSLQKSMGKLSFNPFFLILILLAFGILVGPVNLFVFAKSGQRHKLFITTPIIAIGASLILIALIIFQDGFGGRGKRIQLIEVRADNGENKAYVKQEQIARTGVILGGSFETSSPTAISPVPLIPNRFARVTKENQGGNANYIANHGKNGLKASGDWFQSRSEHGHYLESVISTRGRITLKGSSESPILNSSFSHGLDTVLYCDTDGQFWKTETLGSGKSESLTLLSTKDASSFVSEEAKKLSKSLANQLNTLYLRKGHFVAFTKDAPGIDTLESINWEETYTIITGPVIK